MEADKVRSTIASQTSAGMGLPDRHSTPASPQFLRGSFAVTSAISRRGSSSAERVRQANTDRSGAPSNGTLQDSPPGHLPVPAVPYANSAAAPPSFTSAGGVVPHSSASPAPAVRGNSTRGHSPGYPPEALSLSTVPSSPIAPEHSRPRVGGRSKRGSGAPPLAPSLQRTSLDAGAQDGDVVTARDVGGGKQSITVLRVTCDSNTQAWARSPSSDYTAHAGTSRSAPDVRGAPAQPPRMALPSQVSSAPPRDGPGPRVFVESMALIAPTVPAVDPALPQTVATAELLQRPQQQQQRASWPRPPRPSRATSTAPPNYWSQPQTRRSAPVPAAATSTQPAPFPMPPSTTISPPATRAPDSGSQSPLQPLHGASRGSRTPTRSTAAVLATANNGAALHHRSRNEAVREAGPPLPTGPANLQVSTTTLTTTVKKVRYLLPDEPFHPDAPDPSDKGGLTAEEEAALLDPVSYSCAVHEVAGRCPMRVRRLSAQSGDLLRGLHGACGEQLDVGAPHPPLLLDDGNRWVRTTNRPAVATTREPCGTVTAAQPATPISRGTGAASKVAAPDTCSDPFPAHQGVAVDARTVQAPREEEADSYLLQSHVQQTATGNRLVKGTVFQPPSVGKQHADRHRGRYEADHLSAAAVAQITLENKVSGASARPPKPQRPRSGTMVDIYDEILRRAQQHRRSALPVTLLPAAAPPQVLSFPPPETAAGASPPTAETLSGHSGSPGSVSSQRLSSQPRIPIVYHDKTPSSSEMSSRNRYRSPFTYSGPQLQQQASTPQDGAGATFTDGEAPRLPRYTPHPLPGTRQQQQRQATSPSHSSSTARGAPQPPGETHPVALKLQLCGAPPSHPQQRPPEQSASRCVATGGGATAAVSRSGSQIHRYTSGRFSGSTGAVLAPPLPPAGDLDRFYSSSSGSPPNSVPSSHGPCPPAARAQPSGRMTELAPPANVGPRQPADPGKPRAQQYAEEDDEEGCHAATMHPYHPDDDTVLDSAFSDNTVMDVATVHTTPRHRRADDIEAVAAPNGRKPTFGARDAVDKEHRPLESYKGATQIQMATQLTYGNGSSLQSQVLAQPNTGESWSQRTGSLPAVAVARSHREARAHHRMQGWAPPPALPPPPAASAAASSSTKQRAAEGGNAGHGAARRPSAAAATVAQVERLEAHASSGSCDTDTQPVTVSERSESDLIHGEDDGLLKKGPPVLVLGDEVFAPEGYEYVEEGDERDEEGEHRAGGSGEKGC
ncbi:hypothetical protein LSCM1_07478 [Leishmania martiniquensis]|uniref:Uncharacterized protein n=1 Tax=Leishmania martiniquensis TaxID=1580590 RepID=A0A836KUI9_9TRYP|nr:hypothetical protein LSCM1_07478 [Leishmania martiniquensis]